MEEEDFYNTRRNAIINEYAMRDENGQIVVYDDGTIRLVEEKIKEANNAILELNNVEVDVPNIKFSLAELEEIKLSVADMFALDEFIEE